MKELIIFPGYYLPHLGGVEFYVHDFAEEWQKRKLSKITIFAPQIPSNAPIQEEDNNILILRYPAFEIIHNYPFPKFWSKDFRMQWNKINNHKEATIITHTRFFTNSLLGLYFARKNKFKHVHVEHGSSFVFHKNKLVSFFSKVYDLTLGKLIVNHADAVITISQRVKNFVQKEFNPKKVTLIYRGINLTNKTYKKTELVKSDKINILFVGRLTYLKGVHNLVQAIKSLNSKELTKINVIVVGNGPEKDKLKEQSNNLPINFVGELAREEVFGLMQYTDIFVNPSYQEGLPTTVLEAAYFGNAIIATDVGGTKEIIGKDAGILISPQNNTDLIGSVTKLIENLKMRKELGIKAKREVLRKFNWSNCIGQYREMIQ